MSDGEAESSSLDALSSGAEQDSNHLLARIAALSEAVTARDDFLAIAAHELRNPMTPIMGQVQRLHRRVQSRRSSFEEVESTLALISGLIDLYVKRATVLLDISRITAGKLRLITEPFDAAELIRHIVSTHELAAQHAKCALTVHAPASLPVVLDRLALEQIVDNLLLNAIRYGAGQPVEVHLKAHERSLSVSVCDKGIGISDAAKARIFERFERAVGNNTAGGFGIGLWVVAQLIDAMNGSINVTNVPAPGTQFIVTLPRTITQAS